jgi:formylglycine-generating enzyme required for sulfatase activity
MELVTIKPGTFTMGSTEAPKESWQLDERPEHKVTITKGYSLGKYDVTRGQFSAFVNATGYKTDAEKEGKSWGRRDGNWGEIAGANWKDPVLFKQTDEHPATCISWNDAKAFCDWATKKTGREVRLPTEAEWEYACRAGTKTKWSFGDNEAALVEYGWTNMNSGLQTLPVGQRQPNPWGLYDMHGNVCEWCQDWAGPYAGDAVDPTGPASGDRRCLRGGSWNNNAIECRSAFRFNDAPSNRVTINGFRVAVP